MTCADRLAPSDFKSPAILLAGSVDQDMYSSFRDQLEMAPEEGVCVVELSTLGGDPEVARMMGADIRFRREVSPSRRLVFLGKTAVYSAGATLMSFFPQEDRYFTRGTRLMIHERKMTGSFELSGPLTTCVASVEAKLNELRTSIQIQNEGFADLVRGSDVSLPQLIERAPANWYIEAEEALSLRLIAGVI